MLRAAAGNPRTAAVMAALVPYNHRVITVQSPCNHRAGVDLLELSGGNYEGGVAGLDGAFKKESTRAREAYFLQVLRYTMFL